MSHSINDMFDSTKDRRLHALHGTGIIITGKAADAKSSTSTSSNHASSMPSGLMEDDNYEVLSPRRARVSRGTGLL